MISKIRFILILLLLPFCVQGQFIESLYAEVGLGYSLPNSGEDFHGFMQVPVYGKIIFETQNTETFLAGKFNLFEFGGRYSKAYSPFQNPIFDAPPQEFSTSKRLGTVELGVLKRFRIMKKNRWIGLGIEGNYNRNISKNFEANPYFFDEEPSSFNLGFSFRWQERRRNLIHGFSFHYLVNRTENSYYSDRFSVPNYVNYTAGYRFPIKKIEGEDHELKLWKGISRDTSLSRLNFTLGISIFMPLNFYASAASIKGAGEVFIKLNDKYSVGVSGNYLGIEVGKDKEVFENFINGNASVNNISSQVLSLQLIGDYRFKVNNYGLFFGVGTGLVHRESVNVSLGRYYELFSSQTNFGSSLRTGYKIGRFKHIFAFTLSGKNIPDHFSSTFGWNFGFLRKR